MSDYRHLDIDDGERVRRYKRFYGGLVFDKLWSLGVRDTTLSDKLCALDRDMILAGSALTVKMHAHAETEETLHARGDAAWGGGPCQRQILEAVKSGSVICIDTGPSFLCAQWGEMSSHLAQSLGAVGLLMAGNIRDTRIIRQMDDFPVFTMGTTPNAKTGWIVEEVDIPIYMPGHLRHSVIVQPGDFIFGDSDGVQVIPEELVDEVMLRCEELLDAEADERREIREGMSVEDVFRTYGNL